MESFTLKGGTYAVFQYKGMAANFPKVWQNIFTQWLPNSRYVLDDRAHFEKLPENYNPLDPNAEEEIWIPVKEASEV